jgi:nucleosome assembly protein 1-like 1
MSQPEEEDAMMGADVDDDEEEDEDDDDEDDDPLAHLPDYVIARVERLNVLQASHESIMNSYLQERAALEKKYEALVQPLYEERAAVVRGDHDEAIAAEAAATNETPTSGDANEDRVKGIPQFWAAAMTHLDAVSELICEEDVDCLEHLTDIKCVDRDDGKGFTLSFHFKPNDYFTNEVLTKSYEVPNLLLSDEPLLKGIEGCVIQWKSGRSLTHRTIQKKQRGKGKQAGQVRVVAKKEDKESFFHWFKAPEMPALETMDEEEADHVEELFDSDYEVAQCFRTHIIPKAVGWFTGKVSSGALNVESALTSLTEIVIARSLRRSRKRWNELCNNVFLLECMKGSTKQNRIFTVI